MHNRNTSSYDRVLSDLSSQQCAVLADVLHGCLCVDPDKRYTAEQAVELMNRFR
jgi:hypothetical protein